MSARPLLIELFTEELPPKALKRLGEAFAAAVVDGLRARGLAPAGCAVRGFCTPRRLAVRVDDVAHQAPDRAVELKGPSTKVALDADGKPTQALLKWAEKQGATVEQLARASDGKQECFFFRSTARGETLAGAIDAVLAQALAKLPIPKLMEYQLADGHTSVSFVRPAHRLVVLHGARRRSPRGARAAVRSPDAADIASRAPANSSSPDARRLRARARTRRPRRSRLRRAPRAHRGAAARAGPRRSARRSATSRRSRRCSTRSPRWSSGRRSTSGEFERRVPAGAAGMPDPDDAHQPEVLPAVRRATGGCCRAS